jgi:hypothetical protein
MLRMTPRERIDSKRRTIGCCVGLCCCSVDSRNIKSQKTRYQMMYILLCGAYGEENNYVDARWKESRKIPYSTSYSLVVEYQISFVLLFHVTFGAPKRTHSHTTPLPINVTKFVTKKPSTHAHHGARGQTVAAGASPKAS